MNLLAHLYLADLTGTSAAGQILGDMVKGRLSGHYSTAIENGIRLHRSIDSFTDRHPVSDRLRQCFAPPFRRYAGILIDIGFDYCLARQWAHYSQTALPAFARHMVTCARREWPPDAPVSAQRLAGLDAVIMNYRHPAGLQRALDSVDRRMQRTSPLPQALPVLLEEHDMLASGFDTFFPQLCAHTRQQAETYG